MRLLRHFIKRQDGIIAVEFAFIAPLMIAMFMGLIEAALALGCRANVVNLAAAGSDLIAQESVVTSADMTNVFGALSAMLYPYDATKAKVSVVSLIDGGTGKNPVMGWTCNGTGGATSVIAPGDAATLITAGGGGSVIATRVEYSYQFKFLTSVFSDVTMTSTFFAKPRRVKQIPAPSSCS